MNERRGKQRNEELRQLRITVATRHARVLHRLPDRTLRRNFPLWLAPEQVRVLTLNDDEKLVAYAKEIHRELRAHEVRAEADFSPDPIKAKIAEAEKAKVHTMLVIGGRDMDAGQVSVRLHSKGPQGAKAKSEVVADILVGIKERRG